MRLFGKVGPRLLLIGAALLIGEMPAANTP